MGEWDKARADYSKALALDHGTKFASLAKPYDKSGQLRFLSEWDKALAQATKLIDLNASDASPCATRQPMKTSDRCYRG